MKVQEVRERICKEYSPILIDGRPICRRLIDVEFCSLPDEYVCRILLWKRHGEQFLKDLDAEKGIVKTEQNMDLEGVDVGATPSAETPSDATPAVAQDTVPDWNARWSVSRVQCWLACHRKFWFRYVAKVPDLIPSKALELGREFHAGIQKFHDSSFEDKYIVQKMFVADEEDRAKLQAVLDLYRNLKPLKIDQSEVKIEYSLPDGTQMLGFIDGIGVNTLYEFKYAMDPDAYTKSAVLMQIASYAYARPDEQMVSVVVAKKPMQRLKKDEDIKEFKERVKKAIGDPITVKTWSRDEIPIERAMGDMLIAIESARATMKMADGRIPPANRTIMGCVSCGYLPMCELMDSGSIPESIAPNVDQEAMITAAELLKELKRQ